jgi:1-pyrroline-4-hydroxy-2-carboxylate deaminase
MTPHWTGVFPAITTQMHRDGAINIDATASHVEALIASGIQGIVFLGSLGENQTLLPEEKRLVIAEMLKVVQGRVRVLSGVAETSTAEASRYCCPPCATRPCPTRPWPSTAASRRAQACPS